MDETNNSNDTFDLGSTPTVDFDPFADDDDFADDETNAGDVTVATAEVPVGQQANPATQPSKPQSKVSAASGVNSEDSDDSADTDFDDSNAAESDNPLENAIGAAETKDVEKAKQSIYEKPPVFEYAGATENIEDPSQTFEELRIAKAADFPELDDGKRVKWTVEYGKKITKEVSDPKGMTIANMKSDIETSKEFMDALKKDKDKSPVCKIKPRVTAQSKGTVLAQSKDVVKAPSSSYKGVYTNMTDVDAAGKAISYLPAKDGKVYEVRNNPLGRFITPVIGCELLSDVRAGFIPAPNIPLIPMELIMKIIAFFRYLTCVGDENEALVNIYWDSESEEFVVDTPEQIVSKTSVHSNENPDYVSERYIHYMDVHSHNSMQAFFSHVDDKDEKATRLYTVIGRLNNYFPEIKTRISNGGKFHEIDPAEVFEHLSLPFPSEWSEKVSFRASHKAPSKDSGNKSSGSGDTYAANSRHISVGEDCNYPCNTCNPCNYPFNANEDNNPHWPLGFGRSCCKAGVYL